MNIFEIEFAAALRLFGSELIIIPDKFGITAPPKNRRNQMQTAKLQISLIKYTGSELEAARTANIKQAAIL